MSVRNLTISAGAVAAAFFLLFLALGLYYQKGIQDYVDLANSASQLSSSLDRIAVLLDHPSAGKELDSEIRTASLLFGSFEKNVSSKRMRRENGPALVSGFSKALNEWKETSRALPSNFKKNEENTLRERLIDISAEVLSLSPLIRGDTIAFIRWYTKAAVIYSMVSIGVIWYAALLIIYGIVSPTEEAARIVEEMSRNGSAPDSRAPIADAQCRELKASADRLSGDLGESIARYRELVDAMPEALFETDANGKITFVNRAARSLTGLSEEELAGRACEGLLPPEDAGLMRDLFETIMKTGTVEKRELPIVARDGNARHFEFSGYPIKVGKLETAGFRLIGRDLDEHKRITEELKKVRKESEEASVKLKKTIEDLEEFAHLAVKREIRMHEIRERFKKLMDERKG